MTQTNELDSNYLPKFKTQTEKDKEDKEFLANIRKHNSALDALNKFAISQGFILSLIVDE